MATIEDRIQGGLWGVIVGDALGLPHQFKASFNIPEKIEMVMPRSYVKTFPKVAYGAWSDDGAMTLAFAESLTVKKTLDLDDLGARFVRWFTKGAYTVDKEAYDVGGTTQEAILRMVRGHAPAVAGLTANTANGNGSLMRTLPLALWHRGSDEALYADAGRASAVTHGNDISRAACGVYCVAARHILNGATVARAFVEGFKLAHVPLTLPNPPSGAAYVLDSLAYAIQAARSGENFEQVVLGAIRLGADTDTTAAIAGGLIGVRDGFDAIPAQWYGALRGRGFAANIIDSFIADR